MNISGWPAKLTIASRRATYQQLLALQTYEIIRAESDGIVTARYVDQGTLIPQVTANAAPRVPDDALIFRDGRTYVPEVIGDRIHLARVALGDDDGREVEIARGLKVGAEIALNIGEGVEEGDRVQPVTADMLASGKGSNENHG